MGEGTFARTCGNDENAPIPAVRSPAIEPTSPAKRSSSADRPDREQHGGLDRSEYDPLGRSVPTWYAKGTE